MIDNIYPVPAKATDTSAVIEEMCFSFEWYSIRTQQPTYVAKNDTCLSCQQWMILASPFYYISFWFCYLPFKDVTLVSSLSIMPYIFFWNFNQILQFFILTLKFYIDIESSILAVKVSHSNFVNGILIYMTTQHNVNWLNGQFLLNGSKFLC